ncbi:MAG: hypothetical protein Q8R36_04805 [bacterium]|nr:hypothetical protein [bacterium]
MTCVLNLPITHAEEAEITKDMVIAETLTLSKEVKEFEQKLGITPQKTLSEYATPEEARSVMWIWVQKKGVIAPIFPFAAYMDIQGSTEKSKVASPMLFWSALGSKNGDYVFMIRQSDVFADDASKITKQFLERSLNNKVESIFHEDIHYHFRGYPWYIDESVTTALGYLATAEFFEKNFDDKRYVQSTWETINKRHIFARQLNQVAKTANTLFKNLPYAEARQRIIDIIMVEYPLIRDYFPADDFSTLEVELSHDLAYFQYFDDIMSLYELVGDFKTLFQLLIQELKSTVYDAPSSEAVYQAFSNIRAQHILRELAQ